VIVETRMVRGYTVTETVHENERFVLLRGFRDRDRLPVLLKFPASKHPPAETIRQLEHERDIAAILAPSLVLRPLALEHQPERVILVLEDFRGVSLSRLVGAPMDLGGFLRIAVHAARALAELHDHDVIHKDIRPDNILVDVETGRIKLTELGLASRLPREYQYTQHATLFEGSLAYMSPEQTGRMNRGIDSRTDLYSLGITFYQMLTGCLPFQATDPLEWVYCHVAASPAPPDQIVPGVPGAVSEIVLRLLSKVAEDRYQTAGGLEHDLVECLAQWREKGSIQAFPLASEDLSERFQLPQKLYGRDPEQRSLFTSFERVFATGLPELVLVRGYAGIGKSSLVQELHQPIVAAHGFFLAGKFEEGKRDIPYSTVVQAFGKLVRQILADTEDRIAAWRGRLLGALGINAQLIVDLIPELELVIGKPPPVAPLSLTEEKSRFYTVFRRLLGAVAGDERPLLLFLDDLQWADAGSLALIEHLVTHPDTRNLLLVGAYRDNEVGPTHPLSLALQAIRSAGGEVREIILSPLAPEELEELVADTLRCDAARVRPLSALVGEKTGRNPFFVLQFLTALYERSLLTFDRKERSWSWDLARIEAEDVTDNVVELMTERVKRLGPETRSALMLAACVGSELHVGTLATLSRRTVDETHRDLWQALRDGLMIRAGDAYRFMHDRVRQAAYLTMPEALRAATHLEIGRVLLAAVKPDELEARVFDLVNQYNLGGALIDDPAERERVARLNLLAGRRARASTAYESAAGYLSAGARLLDPDAFVTQHALTHALHFELAICAYLRGDFDRAAELLSALEARAETRLEKAAIRRLEVDLYTSKDELDEAVARGLLGLALFGMVIPPHPTQAEVLREYERARSLLGDRRIDELLDLPPLTDPDVSAVEDILAVLFAPAVNTDRNLPLLIYCTMVNNSLVHGNSDASALAYAYFGMSLGPAFGRYLEGYLFGKLGYDLMERRRSGAYKGRISAVFGDNTLFWTHHLEDSLAYLHAAFQAAVEAGDSTFACYCCNRIVVDRLILGHPLDDVFDEGERRLSFTRRARFDASTQAIVDIQRLIEDLRGSEARASTPSDPGFDEAAYDRAMDRYPWPIVTCWYYIMKLEARVLSGDFREAVAAAARARALLWSTFAHCQEPEYWYYAALALAGHHDEASDAARPAILAALREHEHKLAEYARTCPQNFGSKHALAAAELARIEDRPLDAMRAYDDAARSARENGYVQNEAIANEAAGRFHLARRFETIAATYLREAKSGYAQWGAHAKVAQLERRYPGLCGPERAQPTAAMVARPEQLDLVAVLQASQAISGEIVLGRLLETLVRTVMQHAGAQKGFLLLAHADELRIEAEASFCPAGIRVLVSTRGLPDPAVPASVIGYVKRSRQPVVLDDASRPNLFSADPYLEAHRPRALLCLPILRQTELVGVLYLENNLLSGAFPRSRLTVLELLASQAAISLENALLYAALRRSEELLRAVVDNTTAVIYVKDLDGRYVLVNRRFTELLHMEDEDVIGRTPHDLFPDDVAGPMRDNDRRVLETMAPLEREEVVPRRDGVHTYLSVKFPLRDAAGVAYGVCGISTDITQRVEAEKERTGLLRATQEALRIRDEFLIIASHELRTPLTPLRLQMQLLRRRLQDPELAGHAKLQGIERLVGISNHGVDRLIELVGELLDVSRISAGKLSLHLEDVDLAALVRDTIEGFRQELAGAGCALEIVASAPVVGRWDRFRIEQVVVNLLTNAMKYGAGKPISVGVRREGARAELWVRDEGIGIAEQEQARIFDRFERAVSSRSFGGLGLGLYITRQIVDAHGGAIRVASAPGRGATFTVELPIGAAAHPPSPAAGADGGGEICQLTNPIPTITR
jgi:PAS domain S-box-containing protein